MIRAKTFRGMALILTAMIVLVGISYAYVTKEFYTGSYTAGTVNVAVAKSDIRDFERNIYIVDTKVDSRITYSVVQAKNLVATIDGVSPQNILAHVGDTVKLSIKSDANCNFVIDGYNVEARVWPDTTTEVTFNADKSGNFAYRCSGFLNREIGILEVVQ